MQQTITSKRFTLRLDLSLYKAIRSLAGRHRRSTAKEIERAIAQYVQRHQENESANNLERR